MKERIPKSYLFYLFGTAFENKTKQNKNGNLYIIHETTNERNEKICI